MPSNKEIVAQESVAEESGVLLKESSSSKPSRNWCSIISVVIIFCIILILTAVAVVFIVTSPRISRNLVTLPTYGYLYVVRFDSFPMKRKGTSSFNSTEYDQLLDLMKKLLNTNIQSIAIYDPALFDGQGNLSTNVKKPLEEFLTAANKLGLSVGLVTNPDFLSNKVYSDTIMDLPFMAYYHYFDQYDMIAAYKQAIKTFGDKIHRELKLFKNRTNGIICSNVVLNDSKPQLPSQIDGIDAFVLPISVIDDIADGSIVEFSKNFKLMFSPSRYMMFNAKKPDISADEKVHSLRVVSSIFLSNPSALMQGDDVHLPDNEYYLPFINNKSNSSSHFIELLQEFGRIRKKYNLWEHVENKALVKHFKENEVFGKAYIFNITPKAASDYSHLVLLQKTSLSVTPPSSIFSLNGVENMTNDTLAAVLIAFPSNSTNIKKLVIKVNNINLAAGESLILAVYNSSKDISNLKPYEVWPVNE